MKFEKNIIVTNSGEHFKTEVIAGNHILISDEPLDHEGQDKGPTAHEMLLSSLGSCTAITVRMYADRKQWPVKKITVELNLEKFKKEGGEEFTRIYRKLHFEGDLTAEQIERLLLIADKCPVHKVLTNPVYIQNFES